LAEGFEGISWNDDTRLAHEAKRPSVPFTAALRLDRSLLMKCKDVEDRGAPDWFQALVGREIGDQTAVFSWSTAR
jgi:hypothetical protein